MQRRRGFTLIEILVVMALIILILAILSEAFALGLAALRKAKSVGDMQEKLRGATTLLRRDLAADHFEGKRRLSDRSWQTAPREGFIRSLAGPATTADADEGACIDGIDSWRKVRRAIHMTVKLRGNEPENFFSARVPAGSPLLGVQTTFFNQPMDARFQDQPNTYNSQWAEVAYFLVENGGTTGPGGVKTHSLYRSQLIVLSDNRGVNWPPVLPSTELANYKDFSCRVAATKVPAGNNLFFNTSVDVATAGNRTPPWAAAGTGGADTSRATLLLNDVLNFNVAWMFNQHNSYLNETCEWVDKDFDTASGGIPQQAIVNGASATVIYNIRAVRIAIRVWDVKTKQTRQITINEAL